MERERAIEIVRKHYSPDGVDDTLRRALESLIPELVESEDERVRKVIHKILLGMREEVFTAQDEVVTKDKVLAYLERQKEQMLKDAVGGEVCGRVCDHINVRFADGVCWCLEPHNISHIPADVSKYNIGDKVKIVIIPEKEDKK